MRKQEWIKIVTPEGKHMIAPPVYIKKLIGIKDVDLSNVHNRLRRLEDKLDRLESPRRQEKIMELLREKGKHNRAWIKYRVVNYRGYDLDELIEEGLVVMTKSGTQTMFESSSPKKSK